MRIGADCVQLDWMSAKLDVCSLCLEYVGSMVGSLGSFGRIGGTPWNKSWREAEVN